MIDNVKEYVTRFATFDEPVPYKSLLIYPVLVRDFFSFATCFDVIQIDKDSIPDPDIISMSYLKFLIEIVFKNDTKIGDTDYTIGQINSDKFVLLMKLCLHLSDDDEIIILQENNKYYLQIKDEKIKAKEFDEIIKIIMFQNVYDYFDDYIDPDFKKAVDEYYAVKNKGLINPDLEAKMTAVTVMTGMKKQDFFDMTYREFENVFHSALNKMDYEIAKSAEMSGMVKFDKPVDHWVYQRKKNRYEDAFTSYDGLKEKISQVNG